MKVYLIGTGPGSREHMTAAALAAIDESPVLIGAPRLLEGHGDKTCLPLIAAADIAEAVHAQKQGPISILLRGQKPLPAARGLRDGPPPGPQQPACLLCQAPDPLGGRLCGLRPRPSPQRPRRGAEPL